jgi:hypothetical protein
MEIKEKIAIIKEKISEINNILPLPASSSTDAEITRVELQIELLQWQRKVEKFINSSSFSKGVKQQATVTQINNLGNNYSAM